MCQKGNLDTHNFKNLSTVGEVDTPPPPPHTHTPSPRSVALLLRFGPTLTNPGYTTVTACTGIAKGHSKDTCPPIPPLIGE